MHQPNISYQSPNFNDRCCDIDDIHYIVIHYTGMKTAQDALERLCDPASEVSAHYFIDEDGSLYQLVSDEKRAWHAGKGIWQGITDMNRHSIGIELVNPGHEFGYRDFTTAQYDVLVPLCCRLMQKYGIPMNNIIGHSDYAPKRKKDPGERFDWELLRANITIMMNNAKPNKKSTWFF